MTRIYAYGRAYFWDGQFWRYTHDESRVPGRHFVDERTGYVELDAPELLVHQMLDTNAVAALMGIEASSVSTMLSRGDFCEPQVRLTAKAFPLWSRPVFQHWMKHRPGRGANFKKEAS